MIWEIAPLVLAGIIASSIGAAIIALMIDKALSSAADLIRSWRGERA